MPTKYDNVEIDYDTGRIVCSDALKHPAVKAFIDKAKGEPLVLALEEAIDKHINARRSNEGKDWLSTSIFSMLEMDFERHTHTKKVQNELNKLRKKVAKLLEAPIGDSSLPWKILYLANQEAA